MIAHTKSLSDSDDELSLRIDFRNDPVFWLAKTMLEETPATLPGVKGHELLIEGIVIRLCFKTSRGHHSDSETDDNDERCFIRLEEQLNPQRIRFYGHNAAQLAKQRSSDPQEFLLVSREPEGDTPQKIYNALLFIDRDGDVASRVGVASLTLDNVGLLDSFQPERRLFKLR